MTRVVRGIASMLILAVATLALAVQASAQQTAQDRQQTTAAQEQDNMQTQDAKPFNGRIVKEKGRFVLKDMVTKVSYQLDDQDKAKQFEGKQVKVTGKLDLDTNLIHVESIEAGS